MNPDSLPNGGPACPCDPFIASEPGHVIIAKRLAEGMSLRDYFAAEALGSLLITAPHGTRFGSRHAETANNYALAAYAIADAMLRAQNPEAA